MVGLPAFRVAEHLVGMEARVEALLPLAKRAAVLLLHGMGGIGKTTLAKAMYNRLRGEYSMSSTECSTAHAYVELGSKVQDPLQLSQLQQGLLLQLSGSKQDVLCVEAGMATLSRWRDCRLLLVIDDAWTAR